VGFLLAQWTLANSHQRIFGADDRVTAVPEPQWAVPQWAMHLSLRLLVDVVAECATTCRCGCLRAWALVRPAICWTA
jgi:hypothetical protein